MPSASHIFTALRQRLRSRLAALFATRRTYGVTRDGWAFVVVTLLIGLAALNTSAQLLFLVFALMCSFWTLSALLATHSLRGVALERDAPWTATARRPVAVRVRARNSKRAGASWSLRVVDRIEGGIAVGAAFFARVEPGETAEREYQCVFPRRGIHRFADMTVATRFPFGLIERTITRRTPREIVVLPPTVSVDHVLRSARVDLGDQEVNVKGRGAGLFGIRTYVPGEPSRDIHWRVSARTGVLMTREYETDEKRRASILLDNRIRSGAGEAGRARFERAVVLAGSVAAHLLARGHQVELITAEGKISFGTGPQHLRRCLRALAIVVPSETERQGPLPHEPAADSVQIVVAHRGDEPVQQDAVRLDVEQHRDVLDPAFAPLPAEDGGPAPAMGAA